MILIRLFFNFFKTGLLSVGGGLATLPFLTEMGQKTGWFTTAQLADMVAVSESTPGPIGVNMATFVGSTVGRQQLGGSLGAAAGALTATLGLVTPSVVVILIVARLLQKFRNNRYVEAAFYGLRPASAGLIGAALFSMMMIVLIHVDVFRMTGSLGDLVGAKPLILIAVLLYFTRFCGKTKKLHPIIFILFSAVIGIIFKF